jgi:microcystin-dependent protein
MTEPFLGQISIVGFNFAPRGWATCSGQIVPISQNSALFSLLGTSFGGNGQNTFALPDLRGRAPMAFGNGAGLTPRSLGEPSGQETVTLQATQMPQHTHVVNASASRADRANASGAQLAAAADATYATTSPTAELSPTSVSTAGGNVAHANMQPYLALNIVIALEGIFPSRN